jgi:predicted metal-dependent peptidase
MLEHPYFGTIASSLKLEKNNEILTFISDGETLRYNSEYLDKLSLKDVEFVMANGVMHTVLQHNDRISGRTRWLWQTATDYVVNAMLVKNGLHAPLYANYEPKFNDMYAEEIYEILRAEMMDNTDSSMEQENQQIEDVDDITAENLTAQAENIPSKDANNTKEDAKSDDKEKSNTSVEDDLKEQLEQMFQKSKRQGNLPKGLELVVPEYFSHRIDWREFLYGYISEHAKSTYSFMPPNMKYLYRGICLPSLGSDLLRIVVAIDTSGSIDKELLGVFLAEVTSLMQQYPNYEIDVITADAKVQSHRTFLAGEVLEYEVSGGGGTDFCPVFTFIDENINYPTLLLYFTDGDGKFPMYEPSYDVLWIMEEEKDIPFGEQIVLI